MHPVQQTPDGKADGGDGSQVAQGGQAVAIPICQPKALARKDYLTQKGATTDDFGLTSLDTTAVVYPYGHNDSG